MKNDSFLVVIWIVIILWNSYKESYALRYFELVEPYGLLLLLLPFFLAPLVLLPTRDDDNQCSLWFNLPKSLARDGGLRIYLR